MKILLSLLCLTGAVQACPLGAPYVSPGALRELQYIQSDISLTRQIFDYRMDVWARRNNLTDQYNAYKNLMDQQKATAEQELDEAVRRLPDLINELRKIENDSTLTRVIAFHKEKAFIDSLPPKQQNLLKAAGSIFAPDYQQKRNRPCGPCGPGPFRPGPYGLGLFLPGSSGPGQFWQDLFGPGTFNPNCGFRKPSPNPIIGPSSNGYGFRAPSYGFRSPPPYGWVL